MAIDGNVNLGDLIGPETVFGQNTPFVLAGSLEAALPLPLYVLAASGHAGAGLQAYAPGLVLPAFSAAGAMNDGLRLPAFQLSGEATGGAAITGRVALPNHALSGSLEPPLQLEAPQLSGTATAGQALVAPLLQLQRLQLSASGGNDSAAMSLAPFEASADGLAGTLASASIAMPAWKVGSSAAEDTVGDGAITFGLLQVSATGGAEALVDGAVVLAMPRVDAFAGTGQTGSAILTVPLFELAAGGFMEAVGNATLRVPAFEIAGEGAAVGAGIVTLTRPIATAVVLNTRLKGVVRYEGLAANSFALFAGMQLAATPDGIVALMGDTDLGIPISARIVSGTTDLGASERKRIEAAFVGYRTGGDMEMTLITDEHHEYTYRMVPRQIPDAIHPTRVKFGRGVDGRYWQWAIANTNGAAFDLASVQLNVNPLGRSV